MSFSSVECKICMNFYIKIMRLKTFQIWNKAVSGYNPRLTDSLFSFFMGALVERFEKYCREYSKEWYWEDRCHHLGHKSVINSPLKSNLLVVKKDSETCVYINNAVSSHARRGGTWQLAVVIYHRFIWESVYILDIYFRMFNVSIRFPMFTTYF